VSVPGAIATGSIKAIESKVFLDPLAIARADALDSLSLPFPT